MDIFYSVSKVFACLQGMCKVLPHFVQYNTAECVHTYIFEMSDLIEKFSLWEWIDLTWMSCTFFFFFLFFFQPLIFFLGWIL